MDSKPRIFAASQSSVWVLRKQGVQAELWWKADVQEMDVRTDDRGEQGIHGYKGIMLEKPAISWR